MEEHHQQQTHLLSYTTPHTSSSPWPPPARFDHFTGPSLDLQLSISVSPLKISDHVNIDSNSTSSRVEALKWEAAEQIRLAAMEKAYAEHVMEMTRREMELAQSEFLRARSMWERAREELHRAHKMKERATHPCMDQVTCLTCSHKFTP